ncbi:MAG: hypothetical protein GEV10_22790 [Streptosporangiales bacterium]|nr:hypothetical protein [Streptosporangiales bacterium]
MVVDARLLLALFRALYGNVDRLDVPTLNQAACLVGSLFTGAAATAHTRCTRPRVRRGTRGGESARWGTVATAVAIAAPLAYAGIRLAWAAGIHVGASADFIAPYTAVGARVTEAVIGAACAVGALLTLGLVRPWGEVFPRWLPILARRRVPPLVAVLPAGAAALTLASAGLALTRGLLGMALGLVPATPSAAPENWGAWIAAPLWAVWGVSLAAATLAYRRRRVGTSERSRT